MAERAQPQSGHENHARPTISMLKHFSSLLSINYSTRGIHVYCSGPGYRVALYVIHTCLASSYKWTIEALFNIEGDHNKLNMAKKNYASYLICNDDLPKQLKI